MNTNCKHPRKNVSSHDYGYTPIVARNPDPRAAGNIQRVEKCDRCGAVRVTNINQKWSETTDWNNLDNLD